MKILSLSMASSSHDTAGCADDHDNDDDADVYSFFNFYLNSRPGGLNLLSLWWPAESLRARQHRISRPGVVPSFKSTLFFSAQRQRQTHRTIESYSITSTHVFPHLLNNFTFARGFNWMIEMSHHRCGWG